MQTEDGRFRNVALGGTSSTFLTRRQSANCAGARRSLLDIGRWGGEKECGSYCPQLKTLDSATLVNENCLDGTSCARSERARTRSYVYVYIHGGGYVTGSGNKDGRTGSFAWSSRGSRSTTGSARSAFSRFRR